MGLSYSTDKTDESGKEMLTYGTPDFPIAFFDDDLTTVKVPWQKKSGTAEPMKKWFFLLLFATH